ncbi:hypothetical protein C3492_13010 [Streptomyces sp. Ru62]|uniref:hypothetical protein n=1 Tax=Streptomyces sp. Ru62 TaxID=2080745 RepID=UPI000CDE3E4E|nr:hypothetical protein [Streptomyces sp. Ru62]POX63083.1 hypothetical protein C3492_13010 [Streptomyces sp. Ru62]
MARFKALLKEATRSGRAALAPSRAVKDVLESVARSLDQAPGHDEHLPWLRHLPAHHLVEARCHEAAPEQFRRIGPWCGAEAWTKHRDPVAASDRARAVAATRSRRS